MAEHEVGGLKREEVLAKLAVAYSQVVLSLEADNHPSDAMLQRLLSALEFFRQSCLGKVQRLRSKDADTPKGRLRKQIGLLGHEEVSRRFIEGLPKVARTVLKKHELSLWEVIQFQSRDLMRMVGFGLKAHKDVVEAVERLGLEFSTSIQMIHAGFGIRVKAVDESVIFQRGQVLSRKTRSPDLPSK